MFVTAEIDQGMWGYTDGPQGSENFSPLIYYAEETFNLMENNFLDLFDINTLKLHFPNLGRDLHKHIILYLDELSMNLPTMYLMVVKYDDALLAVDKIRKLVKAFKLTYIKAKLNLLETSIHLLRNRNYSYVRHLL